MQAVRRVAFGLAWLMVAAGIALGGAGIVAGADHLPGSGGRPELTAAADSAIAPALVAADATVAALEADVGSLSAAGRDALAAIVSADAAAVGASVAAGQPLLDSIEAGARTLRAQLEVMPLGAADAAVRYSPDAIAHYDRLLATLPAADGLREAWGTLAAGSVPALELVARLTAHDARAGEAALAGSQGRYADALARLDAADAELAAARRIRDDLARNVDVGTLDAWIARNAAIDAALRHLYTLLEASRGLVTPDVHASLADVEIARAQLPPDTRALVVILADIARGGLNQAVITIEQARGRLAAAGGAVQ
jgi:hypothetical protein